MSNIKIKLITDSNIHFITENGIRGGRCEPIYYHAKANNKYVNPNFDKNKDEESYIFSLDANSLYSTGMCYKLPYGRPKFDVSKYTTDYILNLNLYGKYCCFCYRCIHYLSKLHDRDNEFPILCNKLLPPADKKEKLMSTFYDKENHTISLCMLKYCLEKGLKLKNIHHVIYAEKSDFMKSYITFNNEKRTECSINNDKFGVDWKKLIIQFSATNLKTPKNAKILESLIMTIKLRN